MAMIRLISVSHGKGISVKFEEWNDSSIPISLNLVMKSGFWSAQPPKPLLCSIKYQVYCNPNVVGNSKIDQFMDILRHFVTTEKTTEYMKCHEGLSLPFAKFEKKSLRTYLEPF